jgi:hypothetical protein
MCNRVQRQLCWYIDTVNIVFTFLYVVFYNGNHHLGFLRGEEFLDYCSGHNRVRKNSSVWRLFLSHGFELFMYKTQTNSCYQFYAVQNAVAWDGRRQP